MSSLVHPRTWHGPKERVAPQQLAPAVEPSATPITHAETNRWLFLLVIPFVLCAVFFGLAIRLHANWPMAPAFLLGALPLIGAYIYLALTSDANNE